jgi:hypothetical protein
MAIPHTEHPLVIRTDFSDARAWERLRAALLKPVHVTLWIWSRAALDFLDDPAYSGLTVEQIRARLPGGYDHTFLFIADALTFRSREHPLLVVDLFTEPGRTFRAVPKQIQAIENNLSIANIDFAEFADTVDADGVFRGFRRP